MVHYKLTSQINNQNLFGKDNSNAVLKPAIKPQITTSTRECSFSVTTSNNTKTNGKQQNNRHCPHCNNNHFLATCPDYQKQSPQDQFKIVIKNKLCTICFSNNHLRENCSSQKKLPVLQRPISFYSTRPFKTSEMTASSILNKICSIYSYTAFIK